MDQAVDISNLNATQRGRVFQALCTEVRRLEAHSAKSELAKEALGASIANAISLRDAFAASI